MATEAQVAANRGNGLRGGVKTEAGKAISRMNARKHGIFASALTEYDDAELHGIEEGLVAQLAPVGIIEEMLVEKVAVTYLRMQRCARAEAQHHREMWASPGSIIVRGKREKKIAAIGLYDLRLTNQFLRLLHEVKQIQGARHAESHLDSCLRGNDDKGVKNEPNSASEGPTPDGLDSRFRGNDGVSREEAQEMKNEPNLGRFPNADFRMSNSDEEMENEPNSGADTREKNLVKVGTNLRKVEDCTTENADETAKCLMGVKMKNEPNLASEGPLTDGPDSRSPIADLGDKLRGNDGQRSALSLAHSS